MNADDVAALRAKVLDEVIRGGPPVELGGRILAHIDAAALAAALAAAPLQSEPTHPHDGFAYDGCKCVCCVNIRALADLAIIEERDRAEEWADKLAYAIGGQAIGEHSNLNNPWQNALDMAAPLPSELDPFEALQPRSRLHRTAPTLPPPDMALIDTLTEGADPDKPVVLRVQSDTPADGLDVERLYAVIVAELVELWGEPSDAISVQVRPIVARNIATRYAALALTQEPRP